MTWNIIKQHIMRHWHNFCKQLLFVGVFCCSDLCTDVLDSTTSTYLPHSALPVHPREWGKDLSIWSNKNGTIPGIPQKCRQIFPDFFQAEIFLDTIDALFGDVKSERQVHLFSSLQTSMIAKEAENAGQDENRWWGVIQHPNHQVLKGHRSCRLNVAGRLFCFVLFFQMFFLPAFWKKSQLTFFEASVDLFCLFQLEAFGT